MRPVSLVALLLCLGGCDSPTRANPPTHSPVSGAYSLVAIGGYPTNLFCTVWVDPGVADAVAETDGYYFMYVSATLTFRPAAGEVDVRHRLVSCGGETTEAIDVDLVGSYEQRETLVLITHSAGAESYTDNARLRGDTLFVRALRMRKGPEPEGTSEMVYLLNP